ncbi:MAG: hypothetical protein M1827_006605 [Pycnora praestabilis]|nr:MAG: hypothetical protein M1827_006605 [Pycnora praestabilis]
MARLFPRLQLFEIDDQPWFPPYLRQKVQTCLTWIWKAQLPYLQSSSPARLVTSTLLKTLGDSVSGYTFIDFCAGAGGPTPVIERLLNKELTLRGGKKPAQFLLTDLHPHLEAWEAAMKKSDNLGYVAKPVDAASAENLARRRGGAGSKEFRLFNLAFHHFDDVLAGRILRNTMENADGFGIFELQDRSPSSFVTVGLMGLLFLLITPLYFWQSPGHMFFTYVIPIIPFVLTFDGLVSSLRTRDPEEVLALVGGESVFREKGWTIRWGNEGHMKPEALGLGRMTWIIGIKNED